MKTLDLSGLTKHLKSSGYILIAVCLGLLLLLLPRRTEASAAPGTGNPMAASGIPLDTESGRIAELLSEITGVGEAEVLLSGQGAVVVCQGADHPQVRLNVTNAVAVYTGLGSDKITVMKMK